MRSQFVPILFRLLLSFYPKFHFRLLLFVVVCQMFEIVQPEYQVRKNRCITKTQVCKNNETSLVFQTFHWKFQRIFLKNTDVFSEKVSQTLDVNFFCL